MTKTYNKVWIVTGPVNTVGVFNNRKAAREYLESLIEEHMSYEEERPYFGVERNTPNQFIGFFHSEWFNEDKEFTMKDYFIYS